MLVDSLETMEAIVESRNDLRWNGWDVVKYVHSNNAMYHKDAEFYQGQWMKKKVFPLTKEGWHVPNNLGSTNAQVEG